MRTKRNISIKSVIVLSALIMSGLQAEQITATSSIKAVTIYPGSAKVTRVSKISLSAGANEIVINNLPINLNESSLRVSGDAESAVSLGSVELFRNIERDVVHQREKVLRQKLEAIQDERREVNDALSRNRSQLQYIKKMVLGNNASPQKKPRTTAQSQNGIYTNLPLDKWTEAWQTLDSATASVQEKIRLAEKTLKLTAKEANKVSRELQMVAVNQSATRSAKLQVETPKATELTLKLTYQINGARWAPVYDADLDTQTGEIKLKTLAQISQRTGEDWKDVAITLSTLRPSASSQLPPLNTWSIDFAPEFIAMEQAQYDNRRSYSKMDMAGAVAESMPSPVITKRLSPRKKKMAQVQTRLISTDFSAEYKVPGTISLDSGSNKRRFSLSTQNYKSEVHLASAPRLDPRAMILSRIEYDGETPLLAGSLALYRNGSFVGNTYLQQKQSGEEIKLSFGEDDKVKIKFLPDPDKKRKNGILFGKKKVIERHYKLSMKNNHTRAISISLYDSFPVALNEDIKVVKTGDAPTNIKVDDKKGVVSWERNLKPKTEVKIKYGYTVSYPEDKTIPSL